MEYDMYDEDQRLYDYLGDIQETTLYFKKFRKLAKKLGKPLKKIVKLVAKNPLLSSALAVVPGGALLAAGITMAGPILNRPKKTRERLEEVDNSLERKQVAVAQQVAQEETREAFTPGATPIIDKQEAEQVLQETQQARESIAELDTILEEEMESEDEGDEYEDVDPGEVFALMDQIMNGGLFDEDESDEGSDEEESDEEEPDEEDDAEESDEDYDESGEDEDVLATIGDEEE